jgi:hypothetical protein
MPDSWGECRVLPPTMASLLHIDLIDLIEHIGHIGHVGQVELDEFAVERLRGEEECSLANFSRILQKPLKPSTIPNP